MKLSKKKGILLLSALIFMSSPAAYSYSPAVEDIQDLPSAKTVVSGNQKGFNENHWVYKNLKEITKKHGSLVHIKDKAFNGSKPLTRKEAAILLVNLVGKIEQDNIKLTAVEKAKLDILREELRKDTQMLVGKVAKIETDVETLKGQVSKLEESKQKAVKIKFGEDLYLKGGFSGKFTGLPQKGAASDTSNFKINFVEIAIDGMLTEDIGFRAQFNPHKTNTNNNMSDMFVRRAFGKNHNVFLGRTRVPIGKEGTTSSYGLTFANRSQIARNFSNLRDVGIKTASRWKYANLYNGVYNGSRDNADTNTEMDLASWLELKPFADIPELGNLVIGGGFINGRNTYSYDVYGANIAYKFKKLGLDAEYSYADGFNGKTGLSQNQKADGLALTTTYDWNDKIQLAARYDVFDNNVDTDKTSFEEYTAGINYFMHKNNVKVQLNYVYANNPYSGQDSQKIILQSQFMTW